MFPTSPSTTSTSTATPSDPLSAAAGSRRLRGLSLFRNYTQSLHFHQTNPHPNPSPVATPLGAAVGSNNQDPASAPRPSDSQIAGYFPTQADAEASRASPHLIAHHPASSRAALPGEVMARKKKAERTNLIGAALSSAAPGAESSAVEPSELAGAAASMAPSAPANGESSGLTGLPPDQLPTIRFIPHQDPRSNKPSLVFTATSRTLPHEDCVIRVGRYSERDVTLNPPPNVPSSAPVGFKSKVVSRRHCEFWCSQGQWYIKDVKSSSGTFLNHIRLSQPSAESRPFPVNDGDVVQLGIDFRGGEEQIFRCVKIRIECNRMWQKGLNNFNMSTHKHLRKLGKRDSDTASNASTECSICLMSVAPCQSLFVAPCSHVWHFKCIRPILMDSKSYPQFLCPNCRAVTDLEAEVDEILEEWEEDASADINGDDAQHSPKPARSPQPQPARASDTDGDVDQGLAEVTHQLTLHDDVVSSSAPTPTATIPRRPVPANGVRAASGPAVARAEDDWLGEMRGLTPTEARPITPRVRRDVSEGAEGPLTPRNDAGPFVFDGSAGRAAGASAAVAPDGADETIVPA